MVVAGVGPGDEVITTPMTFAATANAIVHTGATPVFVDCERDTMNIDPEAITAAITPRTKAILPVHFAGRPADMDRIGEIARRHDLLVIEDEVADRAKEMVRLRRLLRPLRVPVDLLVYSSEEAEQWGAQTGAALYWALREGKVVYG